MVFYLIFIAKVAKIASIQSQENILLLLIWVFVEQMWQHSD